MTTAAPDRPEVFSSQTPVLELYTRLRAPNEHHVYIKGLAFADFAKVFGAQVRGLSVRVARMPFSLLNPSYWEPLTRANEQEAREKLGGIVTRADGDRLLIWRGDSIAANRYLRDGIDVPVQILPGPVFRIVGDAALQLGAAWGDVAGERFEWMGYSAVPADATGRDAAAIAREDLAEFRFSVAEERIAYASNGRATRLIFADRADARRMVGAAIRSQAIAALGVWCPMPGDRVCDQILRIADGVGWTCDAAVDLVDKHRTFELNAHLGRTEWGLHLPPDHPPFLGNEKALVYYDRSSGIWAVAT